MSPSEVSLVSLVCMLEKNEEQGRNWFIAQCGLYPKPMDATNYKEPYLFNKAGWVRFLQVLLYPSTLNELIYIVEP